MRVTSFLGRISLLALSLLGASTLFAASSFSGQFTMNTQVASTVPANGDVNPYGVAVVPRSTGALVRGHVLVSNFNNSNNQQGTGTTIVDIAPDGTVKVFAQISASGLPGDCPGGVGLTTGLVVLRSGWVIVGSLPTSNGMSATAQAGCLLVLNSQGKVVETFSGTSNGAQINGPWDMTALDVGDFAELFVTNVLNGTVAGGGSVINQATVVRIVITAPNSNQGGQNSNPSELLRTVIGSGFGAKTDPTALVIGPTGVGLGADGTLYVADTVANRIAAIPNAVFRTSSAGTGNTVTTGGSLMGPLGLAIAPIGNILTTNGGDGNLVETTPSGTQVNHEKIDTTGVGAGDLFGLAVAPGGKGIYYVNDGNNTLNLLH